MPTKLDNVVRRPIITVTVNTAVDEILLIQQTLAAKPTFDTSKRVLFASGKGINVARSVALLGRPVVGVGLVGSDAAAFFEKSLRSPLIKQELVRCKDMARVNTTLCEMRRGAVTHIRRAAMTVSTKEYAALETRLDRLLSPGAVVVFGGTLPNGIRGRSYSRLISRCREHRAITIVDSSGKSVSDLLAASPFMIKPNVEELADIVGRSIDPQDTSQILQAVNYVMRSYGIELVVVSRGAMGIVVKWKDEVFAARVVIDRPPAATSAIGSGDATVAGFAIGLAEQSPVADIVRLGTACGAANVLSLGPGVLKRSDVLRLSSKVKMDRLGSLDN